MGAQSRDFELTSHPSSSERPERDPTPSAAVYASGAHVLAGSDECWRDEWVYPLLGYSEPRICGW